MLLASNFREEERLTFTIGAAFKTGVSGPTCDLRRLCFLRPGSQSYKWQFPHVLNLLGSKVMPESISGSSTICSTQLEPQVISIESNQPAWLSQE